MSQAPKYRGLGLPEAIRSIRQRKQVNTTEFAKLLGVTQGQVSRYESGRAIPGAIPLGRLLYLAEGIEKNLIMEHLAIRLGNPVEGPAMREAFAEVERLIKKSFPDSVAALSPHEPAVWDEFRVVTPNLADLLKSIDELCNRRREVSASLARFIDLWLINRDTDPVVHQCFADAVQYLEFLLSSRVQLDEPEGSNSKGEPRHGAAPSRKLA